MNTPRKKITSLWTLARRGIEPGSSGPQAVVVVKNAKQQHEKVFRIKDRFFEISYILNKYYVFGLISLGSIHK